jgi:hypothetical protein
MANTNKTKAEILQELESIKGLLLEEDHIPILQDMEGEDEILDEDFHLAPATRINHHKSTLPGQTSLFDEPKPTLLKMTEQLDPTTTSNLQSSPQDHKTSVLASRLSTTPSSSHNDQRPLAKASGENPFLPQHIRERLHGNNPPPLFEYETAKKIIGSTKNIAHKTNKPRQYLVEEVMLNMMPQIERELRHRLFAMSVEDLEKLLNEDED